MKHSSYGTVMEHSEPNVKRTGDHETILRKLYVDLCNLIVESRIPGINKRGYGEGIHCPFQGTNTHCCDMSLPECQNHQKLIHYLMTAVKHFEIEVLLFPDCCQINLNERILKKEYILLERWSVNYSHSKLHSSLDATQLLRAVRSFLYFSQISAWLNCSKGTSPSLIYYWIKPLIETPAVKFESNPDVHNFPDCHISDGLYGTVEVKYLKRSQYVPYIPCSKHPPEEKEFRSINNDPNLCQNACITSNLVKQLNKSSDTNYQNDNEKSLIINPTFIMLVSTGIPEAPVKLLYGEAPNLNRMQKYQNSQAYISNILNTFSKVPEDADVATAKLAKFHSSSTTTDIYSNYPSHKSKQNFTLLEEPETQEQKAKKEVGTSSNAVAKFCQNSDKKCGSFKKCKNDPSKIGTQVLRQENHILKHLHKNQSRQPKSERSSFKRLNRTLKEANSHPQQNYRQSLKSSHYRSINFLKPSNDSIFNKQIIQSCLEKEKQSFLVQNHELCANKLPVLKDISWYTRKDSKIISTEGLPGSKRKLNLKFPNKVYESTASKTEGQTSVLVSRIQKKIIKTYSRKRKAGETYDIPPAKYKARNTDTENVSSVIPHSRSCENELSNNSELSVVSNVSKHSAQLSLSRSDDRITNPSIRHKCESSGIFQDNVRSSIAVLSRTGVYSESSAPIYNVPKCFKEIPNIQNKVFFEDIANELVNSVTNIIFKSDSYLTNVITSLSGLGIEFIPHVYFNLMRKNSLLNCIWRDVKAFPLKCLLNLESEVIRTNFYSFAFETSFYLKKKTDNIEQYDRDRITEICDKLYLDSYIQKSERNSVRKRKLSQELMFSNVGTELALPHNASYLGHNSDAIKLSMTVSSTISFAQESRSIPKTIDLSNPSLPTMNEISQDSRKRWQNHMGNITSSTFPSSSGTSLKDNSTLPMPNNNLNVLGHSRVYQKDASICSESYYLKTRDRSHLKHKVANERMDISNIREFSKRSTDVNVSNSNDCDLVPKKKLKISYNHDSQGSSALPSYGFSRYPSRSSLLMEQSNGNRSYLQSYRWKLNKGKKFLGNFEESILQGCFQPVNIVSGFRTEIAASGSFCPDHLTLPTDAFFYELESLHQGVTSYMAHVELGDIEYYLPKKGAIQVTLFNPSETVVRMFILNYDLSAMPPMCHTFIRQKIYYMPVDATENDPSSQKWLRYIIHLKFASSRTGKIFLHKDIRIVVLNRSNDDAASDHVQELRELRSFLTMPKNPTYSKF